jgi:hypothetical protein
VPALLSVRCSGAVERPGREAVVTDHHLPLPHARKGGRHDRGRAAPDGAHLFAKVAEYPKRGAVHFHAVIRLDAASACVCPGCVLPPPEESSAALLEEAVKAAAATVTVAGPPVDDNQGLTLMARWGEQLHVRHITGDDGQDDKQLLADQVAGYVAKYATKSTQALGVTLDHRICQVELEDLDLPAHVAELVWACWELGGRPALVRLRLGKWAHMLGFGGHFSTKSRRYSTTLGALRKARASFAARRRRRQTVDLSRQTSVDAGEAQAVAVLATWRYIGSATRPRERHGLSDRLPPMRVSDAGLPIWSWRSHDGGGADAH